MKNNSFERVLLALILIGVVYIAITQSKKSEPKSDEYYQILPYKGSGDTTTTGGSSGGGTGPRRRTDTLLIYSDKDLSKHPNPCPCCPQVQVYALMIDSTRGGGGGPH